MTPDIRPPCRFGCGEGLTSLQSCSNCPVLRQGWCDFPPHDGGFNPHECPNSIVRHVSLQRLGSPCEQSCSCQETDYHMTQQRHSWAYRQTKLNSKRSLHRSVHSSTPHNSQDMETSKHPSTEEWVQKMCCIYILGHKEERHAICSNMDGPRGDHTKSDKEKDKYHKICGI